MNCETKQSKIIAVLDEKFNLSKKIGKGSTATVYLGYLPNDLSQKVYAFKTINPSIVDISIFEREVNVLRLISHENVLRIFYNGTGELKKANGKFKKVYYIVLEYLEYGELLDFIYLGNGFGEDYGRLISCSLLNAIEAVHNSGIVHRDIKADNIMVSNDFKIKLVDFGFATLKSQGKLTTYLGTPNYAAPELLLKSPYYGVCNDIFSLGVTIFIIVTGTLPFKLPVPNDPLYGLIVRNYYEAYWKKRKVDVSDSFIELFNNLFAFEYSQRPSISEIRNSKWMKEIKTEMLPQLTIDFHKRSVLVKNKQQKLLIEKQARRNPPKKQFGKKIYKQCSLDYHELEGGLRTIKTLQQADCLGKYSITFKQNGPLELNHLANIYSYLIDIFIEKEYSIDFNEKSFGMGIRNQFAVINVKIKQLNQSAIIVELERLSGSKAEFLTVYSIILKKDISIR